MTAKAQATSWNHTTKTYGMSDASLCWLLYISDWLANNNRKGWIGL